MLAYVHGVTRVLGNQYKECEYVGDVQEDGYIYFNDDVCYRIPTPTNMQEEVDVNVSDVQIYYPLRNRWLRANRFSGLKVYGVDVKNVYDRIGTLESKVAALEARVASLESRMTAAENRITTLEGDLATLNSHLGTFYRDIVLANGFTNLTDYLIDWRSKYDVIAGYLGDFWNKLWYYDGNGNQVYVNDLEEWMQFAINRFNYVRTTLEGHTSMLNAHAIRLDTHAQQIASINNDISQLNTHLGDFWNTIVVPSSYSTLTAWLQGEAQLLRDTRTTLGDINTYVLSVPVYNPSNAQDLAEWLRKIRGDVNTNTSDISTLDSRVSSLNNFDDSGTTIYPAGSIESELLTLLQNFNSLYSDLFGSTGKFIDIANEFSALEHQALGQTYNNMKGNGYVLLELLRVWNDFVDIYNSPTTIGNAQKVNDGAWVAYGAHAT